MEILTKAQLKEINRTEYNLFFSRIGKYQTLLKILKRHPDYMTWKYIHQMRKTSYFYGKRKSSPINSFLYIMNCRRFNNLGRKLGIESGENVFGKGLKIFHTHGIVVNGNAQVGENCRLYGNNCIGNDGITNKCPILGDNIRVCVGAKIIGNIELAEGIVVAAGAVVTNSCYEKNAILAGIPAKIIGYIGEDKIFLD